MFDSLIRNLRASTKLVLFMITVSAYLLTSALFYPLTYIDPFFGRKFLTKVISLYCRIGLWFMNIRVSTTGAKAMAPNSFIVCNHTGYLDVLVLASKVNACFVTSLEMRRAPFLGQLCEMGGCLYVDRKSRANLSREVLMLTEALRSGLNICVFPEGTSTDGSGILRFKRPLFKSAIDAKADTQTLCLNYTSVDGRSLNEENRDSIFWYGDMTFFPHLWSLFQNKSVTVELNLGEVIRGVEDYTELSLIAHDLIEQKYRPILAAPTSLPKEDADHLIPPLIRGEVQSFQETHPQ